MRDRVKSHPLDGFSLLAGLVFVGIGVLVLVDSVTDRELDPRWIIAGLFAGLGLAAILGSFDWSRPSRRLERELAHDDTDTSNDAPPTDDPPTHREPTPHRRNDDHHDNG
jgi:hypothetical protein